jgi:polysaccharide export outer membrane protein
MLSPGTRLVWWFVAVLILGASGCGFHPPRQQATGPGALRSAQADSAESSAMWAPGEYRIGPEDVLEIVVWKNADMSKVVTVRPDGMITLPLAGDIMASGLSAQQVRDEIRRRLERYLELPEVSVTVVEIRSYNLYILGEVKSPGKYQVKRHTTLLQAVALAGGFTTFADKDSMVIVRQNQQGRQQRIQVKYRNLVRRGDVALYPGDTIIVP